MPSPPTLLPPFDAKSRLLVFAPHPDDETLATGELILLARSAGAAVRVVFATDGDNNPWPQRWIEKRWRIDAQARARWGKRRREEARQALRILGVAEDHARFMGWPDQGLTGLLMHDDGAEKALAGELNDFAPTHVAMPSLGDGHPDHGALGVLVELAIARSGTTCARLGYVVHGECRNADPIAYDASRKRQKQRALAAHSSQLRLSGARLRRIAERMESFATAPMIGTQSRIDISAASVRVSMPFEMSKQLRGQDLLVILQQGRRARRLRITLPRIAAILGAPIASTEADGVRLQAQVREQRVHLVLTGLPADVSGGYLKLERHAPRIVIFDATGWRELGEVLAGCAGAERVIENAPLRAREADTVAIDG